MGYCGENTGILPRTMPGRSTGDTYQLLLGALNLLTLLGLPAQANTSPEPTVQSTCQVGISCRGFRYVAAF